MRQIEGGVTAAKGFQAAGVMAGIKYERRRDMALIYSPVPCVAAGTFTTNIVKAAPVLWDQQQIEKYQTAQAVVINSGIANACTGAWGYACCQETAEETARMLGIPKESVLIASTGIIGKQIPMTALKQGIGMLAEARKEDQEGGNQAAEAILTTDTIEKQVAVEMEIGGKIVTLGGMAKGSGMIHPNMCTMLAFLTTDACISKEALQMALREDVRDTYNMISVDGDTSTNDTVLLLANGEAANPMIQIGTKEYAIFQKGLRLVNETLAKKIAGDGEGATALFEVQVYGAESKEQAIKISKAVACSNLTKTALAGHDANWGRILCAMGYSGAVFDPEQVDLYLESESGKIQIVSNGMATEYSEEKATEILSRPVVTAWIDIKMGQARATAWGCDLTHGYISINADYRS